MQLTQSLIDDFRKGRLEDFYAQVYPSLLTYAARLLGEQYAFLAEDCVQDAIFHSYQERQGIESPQQWKIYLYTLIHNAAVSILRHSQAQRNYLDNTGQNTEPDFTLSLIEQETLDRLYEAIDRLPQRYKQIFQLSFEQGLHNQEIADLLSLSLSGIKKQKRQMLDILRHNISNSQIDSLLITILLG